MYPFLALILVASPALPKAQFPLKTAPSDVAAKKGSAPLKPAEAKAFFRLLQPLPGMREFFAGYREGIEELDGRLAGGSPDEAPATLVPVGRFELGECVAWFAEFSDPGPDTFWVAAVVATSKADGVPIAGTNLAGSGGSAGTGTWATRTRVDGPQGFTMVTEFRFFHEAVPEFLAASGVMTRSHTAYRLTPECGLEEGATTHELLSGHLVDRGTNEEMWIADDGKSVRVWYHGTKGDFRPLKVSDVDRALGKLTVRFDPKGAGYLLSWSAGRKTLNCQSGDGGVQVFEGIVW